MGESLESSVVTHTLTRREKHDKISQGRIKEAQVLNAGSIAQEDAAWTICRGSIVRDDRISFAEEHVSKAAPSLDPLWIPPATTTSGGVTTTTRSNGSYPYV